MKKETIAIIGVGSWGRNLLREFYAQAEVVWCVYKGDEETKKFLVENYPNIKITTLYDDVFGDASVIAIVVATPIDTHFEIGMKALLSNKHLFLEKPGCSESRELEELCSEAKKRNLTFTVGYEFVHHPAWQKVLEIVQPAEIKNIDMKWFKWGTFGLNIVTNLLCHDVSLLQSVSREIKIKNNHNISIAPDTNLLKTDFDCNSFSATSYINRESKETKKVVTVSLEKEDFVLDGNELSHINKDSHVVTSITIGTNTAVGIEVADFLESMKEKREPKTNGDFALSVHRILDTIIYSE